MGVMATGKSAAFFEKTVAAQTPQKAAQPLAANYFASYFPEKSPKRCSQKQACRNRITTKATKPFASSTLTAPGQGRSRGDSRSSPSRPRPFLETRSANPKFGEPRLQKVIDLTEARKELDACWTKPWHTSYSKSGDPAIHESSGDCFVASCQITSNGGESLNDSGLSWTCVDPLPTSTPHFFYVRPSPSPPPHRLRDPRFRLAVDTGAASAAASAADAAEAPPADTSPRGEPAPIIIAPSAGGVVIASEDTEALDQFEALVQTLAARGATSSDRQFTVFYLKSASATVIAETLGHILGGTSSSSRSSGGGGGSLLGDIAGAALGEGGGGIMGSLLGIGRGGGGGGEETSVITSGTMRIVPDVRLNALVVQGSPADLDSIEQLLQVLDQQDAPETLVAPKPRMIPVMNTKASDIAEVVQQVYQDRLVASPNAQPRQPSPEDVIRAMRGGRGGGGGSRGGAAEPQKMSIGVDTRTNSLVVSASQPLFDEVEQLVRTLDQATQSTAQATRVVTLKRTSPQSVQQALSAMMGDQVRTSRALGDGQDAQRARDGRRDSGDEGRSRDDMERIRARMEFFNNMQRFGGGGTPGGGTRGGGDTGGGRGGIGRGGGGRGSRGGR